ncbi:hypothetical protein OSTOST_16783, partial [Ostertagia ostertagi]
MPNILVHNSFPDKVHPHSLAAEQKLLKTGVQVYCASWHPAYDIRAVTTAEGDQDNSIKLCYYGLVEQNTGDDWNDTDMVLSTSTPSVGGCAPQLATLSASIHRPTS